MTYDLTNWQEFLHILFKELDIRHIDVSNYVIDHLGYRTISKDEYETTKMKFSELGEFLPEVVIRDRRIAIIRLTSPFVYQNYTIEALEILEPAEDNQFSSGFEHAEFVVNKDLSQIMKDYPQLNWNTKALKRVNNPELILSLGENMAIKFHKITILEARKIQAETGVL